MQKGVFSKIIITFVIFANIVFTAAILFVFLVKGSEPIVLIGAWFSFTTVELWQLAAIKKCKERNKNEN